MRKKLLFGIISVIALIALGSAAIYTEPWNVNQRGGNHNLTEMGWISAQTLNGTNIIGTFTGDVEGDMNWTFLKNYPVSCPSGAITALNDSVICEDLWVDAAGDNMTGNLTSNSWFRGIFNWIIYTGTKYLDFNGTVLTFDVDLLNATIDAKDVIANDSLATYIDSQDVNYNTSLATYVNAQDIEYNTTMTTYVGSVNTTMKGYVDGQDTDYNTSIATYLNAQDVNYNTSLATYLDAQDVNYNTTMTNYVDSLNVSQGSWASGKFVPYTGATGNADIGSYNITASWFKGIFDWIVYTGTKFFSFNGTALTFDESLMNDTMDTRDYWNTSSEIYGVCNNQTFGLINIDYFNTTSEIYAVANNNTFLTMTNYNLYNASWALNYFNSTSEIYGVSNNGTFGLINVDYFNTTSEIYGVCNNATFKPINVDYFNTTSEIYGVINNDTFVPYTGATGNVGLGSYNLTAGNVHLPALIFTHTDSNISVDSGGTWYNVTFDVVADPVKRRLTHTYDDSTNTTFTIVDTGIYEITYTMSFQDAAASPAGHINTRVVLNNDEINGSLLEADTSKQHADALVSHSKILVDLTAADEIKFQFTADDTTIKLVSHKTSGVHKDSAVMSMKRVA